jgi:molybdate/tungstate transport system substrate-binding protein
MQNSIEPAFHAATGYTVSGISGGSTGLANQIKGGVIVGDVFISASPAADALLLGSSNGNWVTSYSEFGESSLVLGYNPASRFAAAIRTQPWYTVVTRKGFLLGRTDPATDPKGVLAANALNGVALAYGLPALAKLATLSNSVFPETSLVGRLQAGQLDAGFFYRVESVAANIKTVPLASTGLHALYTIALLNRAPHSAAAKAFKSYILSAAGRALLLKNGVASIVPPIVVTAP